MSEQEIDTAAIRARLEGERWGENQSRADIAALLDALEDERQLSHDIGVSNDAALDRAEKAEAEVRKLAEDVALKAHTIRWHQKQFDEEVARRDALKAAVERVLARCDALEESGVNVGTRAVLHLIRTDAALADPQPAAERQNRFGVEGGYRTIPAPLPSSPSRHAPAATGERHDYLAPKRMVGRRAVESATFCLAPGCGQPTDAAVHHTTTEDNK